MTIDWALQQAERTIKNVREELANTPEKSQIAELLQECKALDDYYKERWCTEFDAMDELEPGTTYNSSNGINVELYIEADDWHNISLVLRKLLEEKE